MKPILITYIAGLATLLLLTACPDRKEGDVSTIIFSQGAYPQAMEHEGTYYIIKQSLNVDTIDIYATDNIEQMSNLRHKVVMTSSDTGMKNFYSPELHRIGGKWYIYFEADNGNTDNHHIYVLENSSADPMRGSWTQHGPVVTNSDWNFGIHPSTFSVAGRQYLIWSGWQKRRTESETQCIFIAEMENPWTLKSERVLLSSPQYEWERQWINPDATRSAYPIFVNENPEAMLSPDGSHVVIVYSASGIWTVFNSLGMLYAPAGSDLLDPQVWTKVSEPQFVADKESGLFGTSNISVVSTPDGERQFMLYQAKRLDTDGNGGTQVCQDIRLKEITWDNQGLPVFGKP